MTIQSDDGRLLVDTVGDTIRVYANGAMSVQQVFDALLPLLPPPVPTAHQVALAAARYGDARFHHIRHTGSPYTPIPLDELDRLFDEMNDLARRWDQAGRP